MKRFLTTLLLLTVLSTMPVLAKREKGLSIGQVILGQSTGQVVATLGPPAERSRTQEEPATGEFVQTWSYPQHSLEIDISRSSEKEAFTVYRVRAGGRCKLKTFAGLNVGSFAAEVQGLARRFERDSEVEVTESEDGYTFLWVETNQMLGVSIADGKISRLYIGPGPE